MANKEEVSKAEVLEHGSVAKVLQLRHNIVPPKRLVIIAISEDPSKLFHTILFDIVDEALPDKVPPPGALPSREPPKVGNNVAIMKIPNGANTQHVGALANELAKVIDGRVFIIPLDFELIVGEAAKDNIDKIHKLIHKTLGLKENA